MAAMEVLEVEKVYFLALFTLVIGITALVYFL